MWTVGMCSHIEPEEMQIEDGLIFMQLSPECGVLPAIVKQRLELVENPDIKSRGICCISVLERTRKAGATHP